MNVGQVPRQSGLTDAEDSGMVARDPLDPRAAHQVAEASDLVRPWDERMER
jgi:hypothetical protein